MKAKELINLLKFTEDEIPAEHSVGDDGGLFFTGNYKVGLQIKANHDLKYTSKTIKEGTIGTIIEIVKGPQGAGGVRIKWEDGFIGHTTNTDFVLANVDKYTGYSPLYKDNIWDK